ncbi:MAG: ABC transporter permease [Acidobacteriia bacterium]|nr:ABC transporter permease [Terriglobia bacterium]
MLPQRVACAAHAAVGGRPVKFLRGGAWLPPTVFGAGALGLWELVLWATDPEGFVLPRPSEIAIALGENISEVWVASRVTGFIIGSGLAGGVVLGAVAALIVIRFRTANETLTPLAVAINAIPIIALAPLFNNWLGITSPRSNQAVVVLLVFFPVFINTARGLSEVDDEQIELMQSYAASDWRIMRTVRIPNALPFFFTALRLVASLAVIAAIVVEYFGGRQDTLGNIITQNAQFTRYDVAWAAVVAGSLVGIALYFAALILERLVTGRYARATTAA